MPEYPKIQAHRGASAQCPENTLDAFALALTQKADGLELDVHLTKDGQVAVAHDLTLTRVSDGVGRVCDYTLAELKTLNFNRTVPGHTACKMPTLEEVYDLVKNTDVTVNVELKTTEQLYPAMPEKLVSLARAYGMEERVLYSSFNHYSLLALQALNPGAKLGLLYAMGMVDPWVYAKRLKAYAIHPPYQVIAMLPETVRHCRDNDIRVHVWTVDEPDMLQFMFASGVDAVITNQPERAAAIRERVCFGK